MTFTKRVLLGLFLGVLAGVFFGERIAPIKVVADGFVKLLQMTVLPYVVLSIVSSLGALSYADARRLGLRAGVVLLVLWAVSIAFALLLPLSFPKMESATFFSTSMIEDRPDFNFVDLYIPSNPFHSLANSIVPAIVLFSVFLGIALIGVPAKQQLLDVLKIAMDAVSRATRFIVRLTPYGIFAIAANAAGTLSVEQISRIEIYLIAYAAIALLLALWIIPGLVAALTQIPIREVLGANRDALVTAFVAGDLFIVLPSLTESCEQILLRHRMNRHDEHKLPEVIIPASFNFPHAGKLLTLSFILFAGWYSDAIVPYSSYPQLALSGLLTIFGSLNAAIPFLLDLFRIPADTFQLYLATGVLNSRFGTLLAALHVIAIALLGSAAIAGTLRIRTARMARFCVVTFILTVAVLGGLRILFATKMKPRFDGAELVSRMRPLHTHPATILLAGREASSPPTSVGRGVYEDIRSRGILRVGFFPNRMPYAFRNTQGTLIGFDVEAAHLLAADIGVQPQFIELQTADLARAMSSGLCDIIMTGSLVTPRRQGDTLFSRSYLDETLAFIVLDHRRQQFTTWKSIRDSGALRIGVPALPHYVDLVKSQLPLAVVTPINPDEVSLANDPRFDAFVAPAEQGAFITLTQPRFTVVVPTPDPIRIPLAYPLARRDSQWADVVNTWVELKQKDGTFSALYRHWILGQSAKPRTPRWSILDNVLTSAR
jgi:Na+/H+-dicarboxylate symporter